MIFVQTGCRFGGAGAPEKYTASFFGVFDTVVEIVGYANSKAEFTKYAEQLETGLKRLTELYDIYNDYEGINNIKTINDNAGKKPVKVDKEIIDLLNFSKEQYTITEGKVNIALGAVLSIWHNYREAGIADPAAAKLPPMDQLGAASKHTDINNLIVDEANSTVYLADKDMSLDVGAIAKGYAVEVVAREVEAAGFISAVLSVGGNIRTIGAPLDGVRKKWGVGLQDPDAEIEGNQNLLDTVFVKDLSVVTSGDYQRYYIVDGKRYHHIIDPVTLAPADYFRAVTIVCPDSGQADALSTCLFILPYEKGLALAESLHVEALWVMKDGTLKTTPGMKKIMKNEGGATATED